MQGDFLNSRLVAQQYFVSSKFIIQQYRKDVSIVESQNLAKMQIGQLAPRELVEVVIEDVPNDKLKCSQFWRTTLILNMEQSGMPFGQPLGCKSVEKAIIIIKDDTMHIFLCEMKSGLYFEGNNTSGIGANGVYKKFKDSLTRFCSFLPVFSDTGCPVHKMKFYGIVFFNHEAVGKVLSKPDSRAELERMALYPAFQVRGNSSSSIIIEDSYGYPHRIEIAFIQNQMPDKRMTIKFDKISKIFGLNF